MSPQFKQWIRSFHKWLGLLLGLYLVFQSLTGCLLAYRPQLEAMLHTAQPVSAAERADFPLQQAINRVRQLHPDARIDRIYYPLSEHSPYLIHLSPRDDGGPVLLAAHAGSGKVVIAPAFSRFMEWVFDLHHELAVGKTGTTVVGTLGIGLLLSLISGLLLWWPRLRNLAASFRIKFRPASVRGLYDLHRVVGSITAVLMLASALSGVLLAFAGPLRAQFGVTGAVVAQVQVPAQATTLEADRLAAVAQREFPQSELRDLRFNATSQQLDSVTLFRQGRNQSGPFHRVWLNPYSGQPRGVSDGRTLSAGSAFFAWMYPIHTQFGLGQPGRLAVLLGGLGVLFMSVTGPLLWWRKRRARQARRSPAGR